MNNPSLLTPKQTCKLLGVSDQTLINWRESGEGPKYHRLGNGRRSRIAYSAEDIGKWLMSRRFSSRDEERAARSGGER